MAVYNSTVSINSVRGFIKLPASTLGDIAFKTTNCVLGNLCRQVILGTPKYSDETIQACNDFLDTSVNMSNKMRSAVLNTFTVSSKEYEIVLDEKRYRMCVRTYETKDKKEMHTCVRVGGKKEEGVAADLYIYPLLKKYIDTGRAELNTGLRIIQFSLYGHQVQENEMWQSWEPKEGQEIGDLFFTFLDHLRKKEQIQVDSLINFSMGSIVFEALHKQDLLPPILILDRALPSIWKVGCKTFSPIGTYVLYSGIYLAGWAASPEDKLKEYFHYQASQGISLKNRKVVLIEVKQDRYFSGESGFSNSFTEELESIGIKTHRRCFNVNEMAYNSYAHHSLPLNKLKDSFTESGESLMPLERYESAASGIIKMLLPG